MIVSKYYFFIGAVLVLTASILVATPVAIVRMQKEGKCVDLIADVHETSPKSAILTQQFLTTLAHLDATSPCTVPVYWEFAMTPTRQQGVDGPQDRSLEWLRAQAAEDILSIGNYLDVAMLQNITITNIDHRSYPLFKFQMWLAESSDNAVALAKIDTTVDGSLDSLIQGKTLKDIRKAVHSEYKRLRRLPLDNIAKQELEKLHDVCGVYKTLCAQTKTDAIKPTIEHLSTLLDRESSLTNKQLGWFLLQHHYTLPALDIELYHAIQTEKRSYSLAYAGAWHIKNVMRMLENAGYVITQGCVLERSLLNMHIDDAFKGYPDGQGFELLLAKPKVIIAQTSVSSLAPVLCQQ